MLGTTTARDNSFPEAHISMLSHITPFSKEPFTDGARQGTGEMHSKLCGSVSCRWPRFCRVLEVLLRFAAALDNSVLVANTHKHANLRQCTEVKSLSFVSCSRRVKSRTGDRTINMTNAPPQCSKISQRVEKLNLQLITPLLYTSSTTAVVSMCIRLDHCCPCRSVNT